MFLGEALRAVGFTGAPPRGGDGRGSGGRNGGNSSSSGGGAPPVPAAAVPTVPAQSGFDAKHLESRLERAWHAEKDAAAAAIYEILTAAGECRLLFSFMQCSNSMLL